MQQRQQPQCWLLPAHPPRRQLSKTSHTRPSEGLRRYFLLCAGGHAPQGVQLQPEEPHEPPVRVHNGVAGQQRVHRSRRALHKRRRTSRNEKWPEAGPWKSQAWDLNKHGHAQQQDLAHDTRVPAASHMSIAHAPRPDAHPEVCVYHGVQAGPCLERPPASLLYAGVPRCMRPGSLAQMPVNQRSEISIGKAGRASQEACMT